MIDPRLSKKKNNKRRFNRIGRIKFYNQFEIKGKFVHVDLYHKKVLLKMLVDKKDWTRMKKIHWFPHYDESLHGFYAAGKIKNNKEIKAHRFIMRPSKKLQIDHINHDNLDNRRKNLRIVTCQENSYNRRGANSNNKSGFLGVSKRSNHIWPENRPYISSVTRSGKTHFLGYFATPEEAYKKAIKFKKKWAVMNK